MEVTFINRDLDELYRTGASRRYRRVPSDVIRKLPRAVDVLNNAAIVTDLWNFPAYKFERLEGYTNRYSMRLGRTWRLEMDIDWEDATCTVGIIGLDDLTSHYGD